MKKVFLFGSGDGARRYLMKYHSSFELIGILDNDECRHGTLFNNMVMIFDPSIVKTVSYDQIIIVSQWAQEIYTQLTEQLGILPSKIVVPPKKEIKEVSRPFEDPQTRELARMIVQQLSFYAIKDKISLLVDFGTLLGLVRDNDIIEWDDDVDFSIINLPEGFDFSLWLTSTIDKINFPTPMIVRSKVIDHKNVNFSLTFNENGKFKPFYASISFREVRNGYSLHLPSAGMWYAPEAHFNNYEILQWGESSVLVPHDYQNYLTFLYGDWQTPKKDISMCDYAHLGKVDYKDFKDLGIGYKEIL